MAPARADALRSLRRIYLDAGRGDEYFLDLGAQAFARELDEIGAAYTLELFDGRHGGIAYRYAPAIRELIVALAACAWADGKPLRAARACVRRAGRAGSARARAPGAPRRGGGALSLADRGARSEAERIPHDAGRGGARGGARPAHARWAAGRRAGGDQG